MVNSALEGTAEEHREVSEMVLMSYLVFWLAVTRFIDFKKMYVVIQVNIRILQKK
jgi:hypothetical protein